MTNTLFAASDEIQAYVAGNDSDIQNGDYR